MFTVSDSTCLTSSVAISDPRPDPEPDLDTKEGKWTGQRILLQPSSCFRCSVFQSQLTGRRRMRKRRRASYQGGNQERIGWRLRFDLGKSVFLLRPSLPRGWWQHLRRGLIQEVTWWGAVFGLLSSSRFLAYWNISLFGNSAVANSEVFEAL